MAQNGIDVNEQNAHDTAGSQASYEQARAELVEVVQRLESGRVPLSEAMSLWERGEQLAKTCQQWLDGARAKVAAARPDADDED